MNTFRQAHPESAVPLYKQITDILEKEITDGIWKYGDKLPNETELSSRFSVSRITVRAALEDLVEAGVLVRIQGKGTYVTKNMRKTLFSIGSYSFSEMCKQNNLNPIRIQLEKKLVDASEADIVKLNLKKGDKVLHLFRILCVDNTPIMLTRDHIRPGFEYLMDEDLEKNSLTEMMIKGGQICSVKSIYRTIEVCSPNAIEAEYLKMNMTSPLLLLRDLSVDDKDKPVRWTKELIAADRVRIEYSGN